MPLSWGGSSTARVFLPLCPESACQTGLPRSSVAEQRRGKTEEAGAFRELPVLRKEPDVNHTFCEQFLGESATKERSKPSTGMKNVLPSDCKESIQSDRFLS